MDKEQLGLIVDIEARTAKLEAGLRKASDRQKKAAAEMERRARESAKKIGDAYDKVGDGASRGFDRLGQVFKGRLGWQIGQVSTQLGDVATQIGGGTSAMRAFGQQAAQILGPFGTMGALAGTAAAALIPLASALMDSGDEAGALKDQLDQLKTSTDVMTTAVENAAVPVDQLRIKYGDLADEVARASGVMAGFASARAKRDALGAANNLPGELGFDFKLPEMPVGWDGTLNADRARMAQREREQALERLTDKTGAAGAQLDALVMALRRVETSNSLDAVVQDSENLLGVIDGLYAGATEEQRRFLEAWAGQVDAVMAAAKTQIAAQTLEDQRLLREYDANTQRMRQLADDRKRAEANLTEAKARGDAEQVASMGRVIASIDEQIRKLRELGRTSRAIYGELASNAKTAATEMASGAFEFLTGQTPGQFVEDAKLGEKGLLELIGQKESGGNYNAQWGNGKYAGGAHDFTNMTIREVLSIQRQMLKHPENTANSSAVGKYQIVGTTLGGKGLDGSGGLVKQLGLSLDDVFTPEMQDRLATELIRQRRPQGVDGLRREWTSLENVSPAVINASLGNTSVPNVDEGVARRIADETQARERATEAAQRHGDAILQAGRNAEFETTMIGRSAAEQARLRFIHEQVNRLRAEGIDLNSKMAGSELTWAQAIDKASQSIAEQTELLEKNRDAAAETSKKAAEAEENTKNTASKLADVAMAGIRGGREAMAEELEAMADEILRNLLEQLFTGLLQGIGQGMNQAMGSMGGPGNRTFFMPNFFSEGGYTGDGGKFEPAGIVHRGEFVMSKAAVQRIGADNLAGLHSAALRGYSGGGLVGDTGTARKALTGAARASATAPAINITGGAITVNASGGTPEANADLARQIADQQERALRGLVQTELVKQMRPGGLLRK